MEPRAAIGEFDRATGEYTLYTTSQNPHVIRLLDGRLCAAHPGGAGCASSRPMSAAASARRSTTTPRRRSSPGPPARCGSRSNGPPSARKASCPTRMAATTSPMSSWRSTRTPSSLALKVSTIANMGAYLSTFATCIPTYLYGTLLAGTYTTPAIYVETKAVFTNTVPVDAYRGAGRPEATFLLERIVDLAADELGIDPAELRRRNFIPADAFPYQTPVALQYDSGDYSDDPANWRCRRPITPGFEAAAPGGGARAANCAASASPPISRPAASRRRRWSARWAPAPGCSKSAAVRVHPTGSVTVLTGSHSHGQGHETTFAQLVADQSRHPDRERSRSSTATPTRSPTAWAPTARARWRSAAARSSRRWTRSSPRAARSPPICSKPPRPMSSSRTASSRVAGTDRVEDAWPRSR